MVKVWERGTWDECALGDGPYRREKIKDCWNKQILLECCCSRLLWYWSSLQRAGLLLYPITAPSAISACKGQRLPQSKECEVEDKEAGLGKRKGAAAFVTTFVQVGVWPLLLGITWPRRAAINSSCHLCSVGS